MFTPFHGFAPGHMQPEAESGIDIGFAFWAVVYHKDGHLGRVTFEVRWP